MLPIQFFVDKLKEVIFRHILVLLRAIATCVGHEPLENFLEGILPSLLIGNVIAEGRMLVKLSEGVCGLFEACFKAIQVHISPVD